MRTTIGRQFYNEQLAYLAAHDVDGLIDNHYNEDAVLMSLDIEVRGRAALKEHFRGYLKALGDIKVLSTDKFVEDRDAVFFQAHCMTNAGPATVVDAFVLKNGKISYHFTSTKSNILLRHFYTLPTFTRYLYSIKALSVVRRTGHSIQRGQFYISPPRFSTKWIRIKVKRVGK